jgi:hypothetical protein
LRLQSEPTVDASSLRPIFFEGEPSLGSDLRLQSEPTVDASSSRPIFFEGEPSLGSGLRLQSEPTVDASSSRPIFFDGAEMQRKALWKRDPKTVPWFLALRILAFFSASLRLCGE